MKRVEYLGIQGMSRHYTGRARLVEDGNGHWYWEEEYDLEMRRSDGWARGKWSRGLDAYHSEDSARDGLRRHRAELERRANAGKIKRIVEV